VKTDASDVGIRAFLVQRLNNKEQVIQYISRNLLANDRKWETREKESLASFWACESQNL
jgi:hypothetical protein